MLPRQPRDPKYLAYLKALNVRTSSQLPSTIRTAFESDKSKSLLSNPFTTHPFPAVKAYQLSQICTVMARQANEVNCSHFSLAKLSNFLQNQYGPLLDLLTSKEEACACLCFSLLRFLEDTFKLGEIQSQSNRKALSPILDFLTEVTQNKLKQYNNAALSSAARERERPLRMLLQVLLLLFSVEYVRQPEQAAYYQDRYVLRAIKIICVLVQFAEKENEGDFGLIRELLAVTSHLYIFNGCKLRPTRMLQFSLGLHQGTTIIEDPPKQNLNKFLLTFIQSLRGYLKLDVAYQSQILLMLRNLLSLQIGGSILINHFQVLVLIIQQKSIVSLKQRVYELLLETETKNISGTIDTVFNLLLNSQADLLEENTQLYNMRIAEKGDDKRRAHFVDAYYQHYRQGCLLSTTINFIFEAYLDQGLSLAQFSLFMKSEAAKLDSKGILKLHQHLGSTQQPYQQHVQILSIILESRRDQAFEQSHYLHFTHPFMEKEWLMAANGCAEVFHTYLKLIVDLVCDRTLETRPALINMSSCIVKIQAKFFDAGQNYYSLLLRVADKRLIFDESTFRYMVLGQAIFGNSLSVDSLAYFQLNFGKIVNKVDFLTFLEYLVTLLKNKMTVLLYLQALIEFQLSDRESFYTGRLYQLGFLSRLVEESTYLRLKSYSIEAIVLLYQLCLVTHDHSQVHGRVFQGDAMAIMKAWSGLINEADCKNICYLFCFRELKRVYPFIREREMRNPKQRLSRIWGVVGSLLSQDMEPKVYWAAWGMRMMMEWRQDVRMKKGLQFQGTFLRNRNRKLNLLIVITTTTKEYEVTLNNDKVRIVSRLTQQDEDKSKEIKQISIKEMRKNPERVKLSLRLDSTLKQRTGFTLSLMEHNLEVPMLDGNLLSCELLCKSDTLLYDLLIKDPTFKKDLQLGRHISQYSYWQVRLNSLSRFHETRFVDKFDFEHAFCEIGEMLQHCRKFDIADAFHLFFELSLNMFRFFPQSRSAVPSLPVRTMNSVFAFMQNLGRNFSRSFQTDISLTLEPLEDYLVPYFHLLTSALLPRTFWIHFNLACKRQILLLLSTCLQFQDFRKMENQTFELFELTCVLLDFEQTSAEVSMLPDFMIISHEMGEKTRRMLNLKFQHLLLLALGKPDRVSVSKLLLQLTKFLNIYNLHDGEHEMGVFLIGESRHAKIIFSLAPVEAKLAVLHYLSQSWWARGGDGMEQIREMMELVRGEDSEQIMLWLMTVLKQALSSTERELTGLVPNGQKVQPGKMMELYLLMMLRNIKTVDRECRESVMEVIIKRLTWMKSNKCLAVQIEKMLATEDYVRFLQECILQNEDQGVQNSQIDRIVKLSIELLHKLRKTGFFHFMSNYRRLAGSSCALLLMPLSNQSFRELPLFGLSILLQYTFEVLVMVEDNRCDKEEEKDILLAACSQLFRFILSQQSHQVASPLVYIHPRLLVEKDSATEEKQLAKIKKVQRQKYLQMRGGVYFKMLAVVIKLISLAPSQDYSKELEKIVLTPTKPNLKASGDVRSPIDQGINNCAQPHRDYYVSHDESLNSLDGEDRTFHFTDYVLMRLAQFLSEKPAMLEHSILESYSKIFFTVLKRYPVINKDINESNFYCRLLSYRDFARLKGEKAESVQDHTTERTVRSSINGLHGQSAEIVIKSSVNGLLAIPMLSLESLQSRIQSRALSSRDSSLEKRPRKHTSFDMNASNARKRTEMLEAIKDAVTRWEHCLKIKLANQFSLQAKQIKFTELLHVHFVLHAEKQLQASSFLKMETDNLKKSQAEALHIEHQSYTQRRSAVMGKAESVRKIYPYTSPRGIVLRVSQHCLPNMACPVTNRVTVKDYRTKRLKHMQSMNERHFQLNNGELMSPMSPITPNFRHQESQERREQVLLEELTEEDLPSEQEFQITGTQYCEWITRQGSYFCEWQLTEEGLYLKSKEERPDPKDLPFRQRQERSFFGVEKRLDPLWYLLLGAPTSNLLHVNGKQFFIRFSQIEEIFFRKSNQIFSNALQFFLSNGISRFVSFYTKKFQANFVKQLQKKQSKLRMVRDPAKQFDRLNLAEKWSEGLISNFDYLMLLNKFSGRTYNDPNMYYVFPWVLQDYTSLRLDLSDPRSFRDLSLPVGAINRDKLKRYRQRYAASRDGGECMFYGSHYSTSLFVYFYLVRLEPYSTLHREMQTGTFDLPDRLFSSIDQVWQSLLCESVLTDIKEAIPEFYYLPAFLRNLGQIDLGKKQCGEQVCDVKLPPWASSAEQFILTMRAALESDYVSQHLHLWIDLIFGKHQNSQERDNIFPPLSYTEPLDFEELAKRSLGDLACKVCQITQYGQCPLQLFKKEHRPKKNAMERRMSNTVGKINSESTASQIVARQTMLPKDWRLVKMTAEGTNFYLEVEDTKLKEMLVLSVFADFQSGKEVFSYGQPKRNQQANRVELNRWQLIMGKDTILELQINFQYEQVEVNQVWIACYGTKGLRVYNWQVDLCWQWEKQQVRMVYIEATKLIFATSSGKVVFYNFLDKRLQQTQVYRETFDLQIQVVAMPRLPAVDCKNQSQYGVLCVGDGRRVTLLTYFFEQSSNRQSLPLS